MLQELNGKQNELITTTLKKNVTQTTDEIATNSVAGIDQFPALPSVEANESFQNYCNYIFKQSL